MTQLDLSRPSKKQHELLRFIASFISEHGYGPSYRDVMRSLDYKSVSTVAIHINNLVAKGHLVKNGRSARSLALVEADQVAASRMSDTDTEWLVAEIEKRFLIVESKPTKRAIDDLYVLVGAAHVLGLSKSPEFKKRLKKLETTSDT